MGSLGSPSHPADFNTSDLGDLGLAHDLGKVHIPIKEGKSDMLEGAMWHAQ